jgi:hypothetical protein
MTLPTVHLNGTSATELTEGYSNARLAMERAITALAKVEFNARDYYVKAGAWQVAQLDREEMFTQMRRITNDLMKHEWHCADSIK